MPQPTEIFDIECTFLSYLAKMNGVIWDTVVVGSSVASVKRIEVRADGEFVHFQVFLLQRDTIEASRIIADSLIEAQANTLAFEYGRKVGEVIFTSGRLPAKISPDGVREFGLITFEDCLFDDAATFGPVTLMTKSKLHLKAELEQTRSDKMEKLLIRFREVFASNDPVDQFMGLYRILENIYPHSQENIEAAIKIIEPCVEMCHDPHRSKQGNEKRETIYSSSRNEISHDREMDKTPISTIDTRIKVQKCLPGFIEIVKKAIVAQR